jgi:hypothetical protein
LTVRAPRHVVALAAAVVVAVPLSVGPERDVLRGPLVAVVAVVDALAVGSALASIAYVVRRSVGHRPVLVVDEDGFYDGASAVGVGSIRWRDVRSIAVRSQAGQSFVGVEVWDRAGVVRRQPVSVEENAPQVCSPARLGDGDDHGTLIPLPIDEVADVMRQAWQRATGRPPGDAHH